MLSTQGIPFCIVGCADLLALFRCISCKYSFSTDTSKPWLMGPVGRVYTVGDPEISKNVQQYDQSVYLRVSEAARCQVNSCMFLPVYDSATRDRVVAVLEIVQTEESPTFSGLMKWARTCLENENLYSVDDASFEQAHSMRQIQPAFTASALESKVEALGGSAAMSRRLADLLPSSKPEDGKQGSESEMGRWGELNTSTPWQGVSQAQATEGTAFINGISSTPHTSGIDSRNDNAASSCAPVSVERERMAAPTQTSKRMKVDDGGGFEERHVIVPAASPSTRTGKSLHVVDGTAVKTEVPVTGNAGINDVAAADFRAGPSMKEEKTNVIEGRRGPKEDSRAEQVLADLNAILRSDGGYRIAQLYGAGTWHGQHAGSGAMTESTEPMASLDILAAEDFDASVGNLRNSPTDSEKRQDGQSNADSRKK